jgi:Asp-tRNA(Asn)/Glu-tRNA(Gln) amidotransferase A subunit family amidase
LVGPGGIGKTTEQFGFKPSFGAIPRTGVHPLSPSLDHVGLLMRLLP